MALRKVRNEPFVSELTIEVFEPIPAPSPLRDLSTTRCALVTEAGLVEKGNPHRLPSAGATHWASYSIAGMDRLVSGAWDAVHGGYDNMAALQDPNRIVPLDALRELEQAGQVGELLVAAQPFPDPQPAGGGRPPGASSRVAGGARTARSSGAVSGAMGKAERVLRAPPCGGVPRVQD